MCTGGQDERAALVSGHGRHVDAKWGMTTMQSGKQEMGKRTKGGVLYGRMEKRDEAMKGERQCDVYLDPRDR